MDSALLTAVGSFGFPIVVTILLLTIFRKTIESNTKAINDMREAMIKLCEKMEKHSK